MHNDNKTATSNSDHPVPLCDFQEGLSIKKSRLTARRNLNLTGWLWLPIWPSPILNLSSMWQWWHHWERYNKVVKLTTPQNLHVVTTHWWQKEHRCIRVQPHIQRRGARRTTAWIGGAEIGLKSRTTSCHRVFFEDASWIHSLFKERRKFGEYHHVFRVLRKHPKKFGGGGDLRMQFDIFDYILAKIHDSLEDPTIKTSTAKNRRIILSASRKSFWKQTSLFLALPLRSEGPEPSKARCFILCLVCLHVFES